MQSDEHFYKKLESYLLDLTMNNLIFLEIFNDLKHLPTRLPNLIETLKVNLNHEFIIHICINKLTLAYIY